MKMEIVNKVLDECNLRRWMVADREINEVTYFEKTFHTFEFENDFWKWRLDFEECLDCEPGVLAIREIVFKPDPNHFEKNEYYGDLLCQNTSLGTRNNFLDLINCKNLGEYFSVKFSLLEQLEENLKEKYLVRIPFPLRNFANWDLNNRIRDTYRIELYDKETQKPIAVLIPLVDERRNNYGESVITYDRREYEQLPYEERMKISNKDKGYYRLYVFPSYEKILESEGKKHIEYFDWFINCRNIYIYHKNIPFFSIDLRAFSHDILESFIEKVL